MSLFEVCEVQANHKRLGSMGFIMMSILCFLRNLHEGKHEIKGFMCASEMGHQRVVPVVIHEDE